MVAYRVRQNIVDSLGVMGMIPDEPFGPGSHVIYIDMDHRRRHALVSLVFTEQEYPHLTLAMIKAGGGICFKSHIPHKSKSVNGSGYWEQPTTT